MRVIIRTFLPLLFVWTANFISAKIVQQATPVVSIPSTPSPTYYFTNGVSGCTNGPGGSFSYQWATADPNALCGKGWNPGTSRTISYKGTYTSNGNSKLAVYGWTRNPLIEYLIVETFGTLNPAAGATRKGSVTCNNQDYDVYQALRINQPSIDGTQTFQQFWSVRRNLMRGTVGGTVDTGCHFNAWAAANLTLGTHNYQILEVDGYFSSGNSTITIS